MFSKNSEADLENYQHKPLKKQKQIVINNSQFESKLDDAQLQLQIRKIMEEKMNEDHQALEKIVKMGKDKRRQSQILMEMNRIVKFEDDNSNQTKSLEKLDQVPKQDQNEQHDAKYLGSKSFNNLDQVHNHKKQQKRKKERSTTLELRELPVELQKQKQRGDSQNSREITNSDTRHFFEKLSQEFPKRELYFNNKAIEVLRKDRPNTVKGITVWKEKWAEKAAKIKEKSIYGHFPSYTLRPVIIKAGDDLRQEMFAIQLMGQFNKIFKQAKLNLWLRPYNIIITSSNSGLVEFIPDTISIDALKKNFGPNKTLYQLYQQMFPHCLDDAQRAFIESLAAYSLFQYLMAVKDRHNGNMLIDSQGHIIHIDFGFILTTSPGGVNFEQAPFKLTQEYMELMRGKDSMWFGYFRTLLIKGLIELKKYVNDIQYLLLIMSEDSDLPCFQTFDIKQWRIRFLEGSTDKELIDHIDKLIYNSLYSWRTAQYDNFQKITNGIIP